MIKKIITGLVIILCFIIPVKSFAWGREGHRMVATIAMQYLSPAAKQNVLKVLGNTSPEDAGTWMDEMRSNSFYNFMKTWHYVDIEKGENYQPGKGDNLISALNQAFNDIKSGKAGGAQRKEDVMILFHLLGDMHQPLHTGYPEDKGGNTVQVNFEGTGTNLHHIWDDDIIEVEHITIDSCLKLARNLNASQVTAICKGNFVDWMNDSRSLLPRVYDFSGHKLNSDYADKNKELVEDQLLKGGIRLAKTLELLFNKPMAPTVTRDEIPEPAREKAAAPKDGMITPEDAINHIGETLTVAGKVYGGKYLEDAQGAPTFINMGAAYPGSPFTIVIYGTDRSKFSNKPETWFDGKTIKVTGKIKEFKGKAEIVVTETSQIQE